MPLIRCGFHEGHVILKQQLLASHIGLSTAERSSFERFFLRSSQSTIGPNSCKNYVKRFMDHYFFFIEIILLFFFLFLLDEQKEKTNKCRFYLFFQGPFFGIHQGETDNFH